MGWTPLLYSILFHPVQNHTLHLVVQDSLTRYSGTVPQPLFYYTEIWIECLFVCLFYQNGPHFWLRWYFLMITFRLVIHRILHERYILRYTHAFFKKKDFIYLFLERGKKKEKEREEKHCCEGETSAGCLLSTIWKGTEPATQACALTRNQTGDPSLYRMSPSQLSPTSQDHPCFLDLSGFSLLGAQRQRGSS